MWLYGSGEDQKKIKKRFKTKDSKYQVTELMLSLVNKGDQTRGLSQENWMNISKGWINENEEESYYKVERSLIG